MHASCNVYTGEGADALYEQLFEEADTVRELLQGIPGFVSHTMVETESGGFSQVVVERLAALADVGRIAGGYIKKLAAKIGKIDPPKSDVGPVGMHV